MLDDKVKAIITKKLAEWEGEALNADKLGELRELITKKTGKHKFLPYTNLKKWIREVKKEMRATHTVGAKKKTTESEAEAQVATAPSPRPVHTEELPQKTVMSPFADRVYFQNLAYEVGSMRRTLERISKQLDELENQLKEFRESKESK